MRVGSLFGIEIKVNVSWIFVFALVTWGLANPLGPLHLEGVGVAERVVLGATGALLFFASVLLHELAHSLLARRRGIKVRGITLFIFGGVSQFEGEAGDAPAEAWISVVGPLMSLALGAIFWLLYAFVAAADPASHFGMMFAYLSGINVLLAIFNLIPAYPLDGGRVLHALIWKASGDRRRATRVTVAIGRVLAGVMIALGIGIALGKDSFGGLWLTFIGWFLLQAGAAEQTGAAIAEALGSHVAAELAAPPELQVAADATAARALELMRQTQVRALPVRLGDSIIGVVSLDELAGLSDEELARTYVTALMARPENVTSAPATTPARKLVETLAQSGVAAIALTAANGSISGLFTRESVMRWLARPRT